MIYAVFDELSGPLPVYPGVGRLCRSLSGGDVYGE